MKSIYFRHSAISQDEWTFDGYVDALDTAELYASKLLAYLFGKGHDHAEVSITDRDVLPTTDMP